MPIKVNIESNRDHSDVHNVGVVFIMRLLGFNGFQIVPFWRVFCFGGTTASLLSKARHSPHKSFTGLIGGWWLGTMQPAVESGTRKATALKMKMSNCNSYIMETVTHFLLSPCKYA